MDTRGGKYKLACSRCLLIYLPNTTTKSYNHHHHHQDLSILASTLEHSHITQHPHLSTIHLIHERRRNASSHKPLTFSYTYTHNTKRRKQKKKRMAPTRNITLAQWAEQTYGPSSKPTLNKISDVEYLVCVKYLKNLSESGLVFPAKHPSTPSSFFSTSPSVDNAFHFGASTQTTTPGKTTPAKTKTTPLESSATAQPTQTGFATTFTKVWPGPTESSANFKPHRRYLDTPRNMREGPRHSSTTTDASRPEFSTATRGVPLIPTKATAQKKISKTEPELPSLEIDQHPDPTAVYRRDRSLSSVDQLEHLVKIKIDNFREHVRVHVPLDSHQSCIDREEEKRRRMFFEENGEEAYRARYIDSDYSGHVEFLYIDPAEVQWKRIV